MSAPTNQQPVPAPVPVPLPPPLQTANDPTPLPPGFEIDRLENPELTASRIRTAKEWLSGTISIPVPGVDSDGGGGGGGAVSVSISIPHELVDLIIQYLPPPPPLTSFLSFKTLGGMKYELNVRWDTTVGDLKERIASKAGGGGSAEMYRLIIVTPIEADSYGDGSQFFSAMNKPPSSAPADGFYRRLMKGNPDRLTPYYITPKSTVYILMQLRGGVGGGGGSSSSRSSKTPTTNYSQSQSVKP